MFALPFDPDKLEVRGTPSAVLEEVAYNTLGGSAQLDFSRNGTLVYRNGGTGLMWELAGPRLPRMDERWQDNGSLSALAAQPSPGEQRQSGSDAK